MTEHNTEENNEQSRIQKFLVFLFIILVALGLISGLSLVVSDNDKKENEFDRIDFVNSSKDTTVLVFYYDCPSCDIVVNHVEDKASDHENVEVKKYNVSKNEKKNRTMYKESIERYGIGVPAVQIGNNTWFGYSDDVEDSIQNKIDKCAEKDDGCGFPDKHALEIYS